jgi:hypothetical protein
LALAASAISLTIPFARPMPAAPQAHLSRGVASIRLAPLSNSAILPADSPGSSSMLAAGAALMAIGLMGRKRRAEKWRR